MTSGPNAPYNLQAELDRLSAERGADPYAGYGAQSKHKPAKQRSKFSSWITIAVILLMLGTGGYFGYTYFNRETAPPPSLIEKSDTAAQIASKLGCTNVRAYKESNAKLQGVDCMFREYELSIVRVPDPADFKFLLADIQAHPDQSETGLPKESVLLRGDRWIIGGGDGPPVRASVLADVRDVLHEGDAVNDSQLTDPNASVIPDEELDNSNYAVGKGVGGFGIVALILRFGVYALLRRRR